MSPLEQNSLKGVPVQISERQIAFESGATVFVPKFEISYSAVTIGEYLAFQKSTGHKTEAERSGSKENFHSNFAVSDCSEKAKLERSAHCLSYNDALVYCLWAKRRLPTEAEVFSAFLCDTSIYDSHNGAVQSRVQELLNQKKVPRIGGLTITSTMQNDDQIVFRNGPRYILERGWERDVRFNREIHSKIFYDIRTSFHVCL